MLYNILTTKYQLISDIFLLRDEVRSYNFPFLGFFFSLFLVFFSRLSQYLMFYYKFMHESSGFFRIFSGFQKISRFFSVMFL